MLNNRAKKKCYEVNCSKPPLKKVGINMLRILGIQPGTEEYDRQKHLIAVGMCQDHFLERFPSYVTLKKAFFQGILMISKAQYIALSKELYNTSLGKMDEGDFKGAPRN
ncbi:MAG: hypothetical protein AB2L14_08695 [Candidatus Xenobiia bacterium LiM19]